MIYVHCENEGGNARNAYVGPHQPGEASSLTSIFISLFIFPNRKTFLGLLVSIGLVDHVHDGSGTAVGCGPHARRPGCARGQYIAIYRFIAQYLSLKILAITNTPFETYRIAQYLTRPY